MPNLPTAPRATPALSSPLENALSFIDDEAARQIAADPALIREAKSLVPALTHRAHIRAERSELKNIIMARFPLYPQPRDRQQWEWDVWWADYFDTLEGLTAEAVDSGLKAWIAKPDSHFLPKPGELRALALATPTPTARTLAVLKKAVAAAEAPAPVHGRPMDPPRLRFIPKPEEDRAFVERAAAEHRADFLRRQTERPRPPGNFHLSQGVPGPRGITPELARLLKAQQPSEA